MSPMVANGAGHPLVTKGAPRAYTNKQMLARAWCAFRSVAVLCGFVTLLTQAVFGEPASFEGKKIARILFVPREQPLEADEIHRILPVKEQAPLQLEEVRSAIDRLYATGVYADIQVDAELRNDEVI